MNNNTNNLSNNLNKKLQNGILNKNKVIKYNGNNMNE
jgi:hypothetical protein